MQNSPVQIVLNSSDFIVALENSGGGGSKDFFAGSDVEFIAHKENIIGQLNDIKRMQLTSAYGGVSYAKVILKPEALAKSHRPTTAIFKKGTVSVVGAGELGEFIVELTPSAVDQITNIVNKAENETTYALVDGKEKVKPSRIRSEVGSIKEIESYTSADKIGFSVNEAISWLKKKETSGCYIVELFEPIPPKRQWDLCDSEKLMLFSSFTKGLEEFSMPLYVSPIKIDLDSNKLLAIRIQSAGESIIKLFSRSVKSRLSETNEFDENIEKHAELLQFLGNHPLVKSVSLPPFIEKVSDTSVSSESFVESSIPEIVKDKSYPKLCIVDGGVSDIYGEWIEDRWGLLSSNDIDHSHGTFIAGLAVLGQQVNGPEICPEFDGCKIIDLDILPKNGSYNLYFDDPLALFTELEAAVIELKARTGVRVFNFSLNIQEHPTSRGYSFAARILDRIAEENDIIFIISAGNISSIYHREEWPSDSTKALAILATTRNDALLAPAESARNISVSALNPPGLKDIIPYALSNYSCRGPGLKIGLKPDLAHVGGAGPNASGHHGLSSLDPSGKVVNSCGTSYAAPAVAKTMASLENLIEGEVSRETLMALTIHNSNHPETLQHKDLKKIAKHLVGFGIPNGSDEILRGKPSAITLVFANRSKHGHRMSFKFSWPSSLVKNGKCIGHARMTLISSPPFDYDFGDEFVRVNIEASLRQLQDNGVYKGRLQAIYTPEDKEISQKEKSQIEHMFKWAPVKAYEKSFPRGVGPSTDWTLDVEYLTRDGVKMPEDGVPFTVILTISDPAEAEPVFNDMRQSLQSVGVVSADIKTAARITQRI